jgi:hypothetical protein
MMTRFWELCLTLQAFCTSKEDMLMIDSNENLEFDLGDGEQETTVTIEEKEGQEPSVQVQSGPDSEELDQYSEKVKKRIDKLTARLRETERREQSALEYAKSVQARNEELQREYERTAVERVGETKSRIETQITALKNVIRRAREEGDIDTETEANQRLTAAIWEQQQLARQRVAVQQQTQQRAPIAQQPVQQPVQQAPRVDVKAEEWAEKNPWFGSDVVMTNTVRGIHVELIKNEGFDPQSDEYYDEIDRRMQELFPKKFSGSAQQTNRSSRPVQTVASATRSSGVNTSARRSIRLSPSQVAMAKKLNVPLEKYAQYVKR